jgi:IS1 family transposase
MNRLSTEKRVRVVAALVEGNSIRATVRMTGVSKPTILKLFRDLGPACERAHDRLMVNLPCKRLQCDEIWSFCYAKKKNVPFDKCFERGVGDVWTWTAICADSKVIASWLVGGRDAGCAHRFLTDVASRLANRVQLTTDSHGAYLNAVPRAFANQIDYAVLVKLYGNASGKGPEARYSPGEVNGTKRRAMIGQPDPAHISTSYAERHNLTMRMSMRRFTRPTNAFSKKIEYHEHSLALYFAYYNLCRPHQTLGGRTPAQAAGVTDRKWTIEDLIGLLNET